MGWTLERREVVEGAFWKETVCAKAQRLEEVLRRLAGSTGGAQGRSQASEDGGRSCGLVGAWMLA